MSIILGSVSGILVYLVMSSPHFNPQGPTSPPMHWESRHFLQALQCGFGLECPKAFVLISLHCSPCSTTGCLKPKVSTLIQCGLHHGHLCCYSTWDGVGSWQGTQLRPAMEGPKFIHNARLLQSTRRDMGWNFGLSCRNHRFHFSTRAGIFTGLGPRVCWVLLSWAQCWRPMKFLFPSCLSVYLCAVLEEG